jgi:hypothetical protein
MPTLSVPFPLSSLTRPSVAKVIPGESEMSNDQFDEIDPALEAALELPEDQLIALDLLIEKLGGIEEAREVLESLQSLRRAA